MKLDLAVNLSALDVTQWDFEVWLYVMLLTQAFAIALCVWHDLRRTRSPVERLVRGKHFGV